MSSAVSFACLLCLSSVAAVKLMPKASDDGETSRYYWPSGRGFFGSASGGATQAVAPFDLKGSLKWTWHGQNRYSNVPNGANIDDHKNIYLTSFDGIRKFSPDGTLLWTYNQRVDGEELPDQASLYKGALYVSTTYGRIIALDMKTGKEIWTTKVEGTDGNNGWVSVDEGTVITGTNPADVKHDEHIGDTLVTGFNASDGRILWNYKPDTQVWNWHGSFAGDGTFIFQDYEGKAYRCRVSDGTEVWKKGGVAGSWTDGSAILGPNRVVYTVNNRGMGNKPYTPGDVVARRLEDGELLWTVEVPHAPNNIPAIGRLFGREGLSLVQPIGQQVVRGAPTFVYALDADTGKVQWIFNGPVQKEDLQAGDSNPIAQFERVAYGHVRAITLPNPWSAPSIDGSGTVFIGSEEGPLYALRDANGDGHVDGETEVSSLDTEACFSGSMSPAIAPGMLVAGSIDQLYVFMS